MTVTINNGEFLTEEQNKIKVKIIKNLLIPMFNTLEENKDIIDSESAFTIITSCYIVFSTQLLSNLLLNSNGIGKQDELLGILFKEIKNRVLEEIKKNSN